MAVKWLCGHPQVAGLQNGGGILWQTYSRRKTLGVIMLALEWFGIENDQHLLLRVALSGLVLFPSLSLSLSLSLSTLCHLH